MIKTAVAHILVLGLALGAVAQEAPELISPTYGQHFVQATGTHFAWLPKAGYNSWVLQVADNQGLAHPLVTVPLTTTSYRIPGSLPAGTRLFWRVSYINVDGQEFHSGLGHFWTAPVRWRAQVLN